MKSIGSLGHIRAALSLTFDYFGKTVRVHPFATDAVEAEYLAAVGQVDASDLDGMDAAQFSALPPERQAEVMRTLTAVQQAAYRATVKACRDLIHPDDFQMYWDTGNANGQQIRDRMRDMKVITTAVLAEETDFPTGPPADSDGGRPTTPASSEVVSYSPVPGQPDTPAVPVSDEVRDFQAALALNRGRPDLQEFIVMERENRLQALAERQDAERRDRERMQAAGLLPGGSPG